MLVTHVFDIFRFIVTAALLTASTCFSRRVWFSDSLHWATGYEDVSQRYVCL